MASELKWSLFAGFTPRASSALLRHSWPGNVRELKNCVERSVYRSTNPEEPIRTIAFDPFDSPFKLAPPAATAVRSVPQILPPLLPTDLRRRLDDMEKDLLKAALDKARFNQRMAADMLGLSYHQLRGKMRKHAISGKPGTRHA